MLLLSWFYIVLLWCESTLNDAGFQFLIISVGRKSQKRLKLFFDHCVKTHTCPQGHLATMLAEACNARFIMVITLVIWFSSCAFNHLHSQFKYIACPWTRALDLLLFAFDNNCFALLCKVIDVCLLKWVNWSQAVTQIKTIASN